MTRPPTWFSCAPDDYVMVFEPIPIGEHYRVSGRFETVDASHAALDGLEGGYVSDSEVAVYCSLPGEEDRVLAHLFAKSRDLVEAEPGALSFVAIRGTMAVPEASTEPRNAGVHIVTSCNGLRPRCYAGLRQCERCGEFLGRIHVLPDEVSLVDTRTLSCRCDSIPCRYCDDGHIRRPMAEHLDPEMRPGRVPWFGYLVPCGDCIGAGRGPAVTLSSDALS